MPKIKVKISETKFLSFYKTLVGTINPSPTIKVNKDCDILRIYFRGFLGAFVAFCRILLRFINNIEAFDWQFLHPTW